MLKRFAMTISLAGMAATAAYANVVQCKYPRNCTQVVNGQYVRNGVTGVPYISLFCRMDDGKFTSYNYQFPVKDSYWKKLKLEDAIPEEITFTPWSDDTKTLQCETK